jgi:hypothetical protein
MLDENYKIFILFHWKKRKLRLLLIANNYKKMNESIGSDRLHSYEVNMSR